MKREGDWVLEKREIVTTAMEFGKEVYIISCGRFSLRSDPLSRPGRGGESRDSREPGELRKKVMGPGPWPMGDTPSCSRMRLSALVVDRWSLRFEK